MTNDPPEADRKKSRSKAKVMTENRNQNYKKDIERLLPFVSKPSRYINSEWNAVHAADGSKQYAVCLCFPDLYELGISNLSIEILYNIINKNPEWTAERCYCPDHDMAAKLQEHGLKLFSLESARPLHEFEIVGFTLQHELCYTNVLHMLDRAGIPLKAADRDASCPLIIGGGPCAVNPEPMAEFFDAFVIGDGEDVITEIIDCIAHCRSLRIADKHTILKKISAISGVYVPRFYDVRYNKDGTVSSVDPKEEDIPRTIEKRIVDLEKAPYPEKPLVPFTHAVHDRYTLEIARGCVHRCRFCQASRVNHPVRERSVKRLLELAEQGLSSSGFEELALSALSSSDYTHMDELIKELLKRYEVKRISISLPSLRCTEKSLNLARLTRGVKKSSLTFAPEVGTPRMRAIINKKLDGSNIPSVLKRAHDSGWKHIKLYFMYGLPWEKEDDLQGIIRMVTEAKKKNKMLNFNITVSPFVPKAQTPFQWCPQDAYEMLDEKRRKLIKKVPGNVRAHGHDAALLEAVFARGDRRLSAVILNAYKNGCIFDQWRERLRYDVWRRSFQECGFDPQFYANRTRNNTEIFPWDHLTQPGIKDLLFKEYETSKECADNPALCEDAPVHKTDQAADKDKDALYPHPAPLRSVQRVRLRFKRFGPIRFLSHLEQLTAFRRILRRADIPLAYTLGFHPQPRTSFGPAISVGYSSDAEYVDVELTRKMDLAVISTLIAKQLPNGFQLINVKRIPVFFPSLESTVNRVLYHIDGAWPSYTGRQIEDFFQQKEFWIEKVKKNSTERINLTSIVKNISLTNGSLNVLMDFGPKKNIKPTLLIRKLFNFSEKEVESFHVHKVALYMGSSNKEYREP